MIYMNIIKMYNMNCALMSTTCEHHKSESPPPLQTVKAQFTLTRFGSSRRSVGAGRGRRLGRWRRRIRDHRGVDRLRHLGRVARRHHLHVLLVLLLLPLLVELLVLQPLCRHVRPVARIRRLGPKARGP